MHIEDENNGAVRALDLPFLDSRRVVDPFDPTRVMYFMLVDTRKLGEIPNEANARSSSSGLNKEIYKRVRRSVMDGVDVEKPEKSEAVTPGLFGYKNNGVHIIADRVEKVDGESNVARIFYREPNDEFAGDGSVNGGHTIEIIRRLQSKHIAEMPSNWVFVRISTRIPREAVAEISLGNNQSMQVTQDSLANLEKKFEPFKKALLGTHLEGNVDWGSGDKGEVDAQTFLATLACFIPSKKSPIYAYEKKSYAVEEFRKDPKPYEKLLPILNDILDFTDHVRTTGAANYEGSFGKLKFVQNVDPKKPPMTMPFTGKLVRQRLGMEAATPILAAFRHFVVEGEDGNYKWRKDVNEVKSVWNAVSAQCIEAAREALKDKGYVLNALGKSRQYWSAVEMIVENAMLRKRIEEDDAA